MISVDVLVVFEIADANMVKFVISVSAPVVETVFTERVPKVI